MKSQIVLCFLILGITVSCSSHKKTAASMQNASDSIAFRDTVGLVSPGDGKSFKTAVMVKESSETKGVPAEYQWIRNHYTDYKVVRQSLTYNGKKPYDIITIQFRDERKQDVYFDISKFFK